MLRSAAHQRWSRSTALVHTGISIISLSPMPLWRSCHAAQPAHGSLGTGDGPIWEAFPAVHPSEWPQVCLPLPAAWRVPPACHVRDHILDRMAPSVGHSCSGPPLSSLRHRSLRLLEHRGLRKVHRGAVTWLDLDRSEGGRSVMEGRGFSTLLGPSPCHGAARASFRMGLRSLSLTNAV